MPARKKEDVALSVIERIMSAPVPNAGELKHPVQPRKRAAGQITLDDLTPSTTAKETDITEWSTRDFVDYFGKQYQDEIGGNYRKLYRSDCGVFLKFFSFMRSNGLEPRQWTKNAVDWGFRRREFIQQKRGAFTPLEILSMVNYFYQEEAIPKVETGQVVRVMGDTSLLDEIKEALAHGKERQVFIDFGIPVTATYMTNISKLPLDLVENGIKNMLNNLKDGGAVDHEKLGKIFMASVVGSPYPEGFVLTDWRDRFPVELGPFRKEDWFRSTDYKLKYLPKYDALTEKQNGI